MQDNSQTESEARFKAVFDNAAVGIAMMTLDRRIVQINPTVTRLTGYSPEEMYSVNPTDLVDEADRLIDRELFLDLVAGRRDQYLIEKRYRRRDGSLFWGRINFALVRDEQGQPHTIVAMIEDISEEKAAQQTLAESEARFRAMFENSAVGIGLMSLERVVLDSNPALCAMLGYTRQELIGQNPALITHPEDFSSATEQFEQLLSGEINHYISERRYLRKNGEVFWAQVSMSLVRDPNGNPLYLVGLINDIDAQKRAAERLAEQEAAHRRQLEQRIAASSNSASPNGPRS